MNPRVIGLIGGMSWESTIPYYRQINEAIKERLGGLHSARIVLYSVDFHEARRAFGSGAARHALYHGASLLSRPPE